MGTKTQSKRILALDIMRGITIAGMILVNNPGNWGACFAPLRHAQWIGLTPTDLVFPFFMFIMGITTFVSLQRYGFRAETDVFKKIITRTVGIIIVGIFINWFAHFCYFWGYSDESLSFGEKLLQAANVFPTLRFTGVLHRLAICYGIVAVLAVTINHKRFPMIIVGLFIIYFIILELGNGYSYDETNILSIVDRAILSPAHMYNDNGIDPEGILSTIPSVGHVMIGFCMGSAILSRQNEAQDTQDNSGDMYKKITTLLLAGASMLMAGFLLSYACPISKKLWTPTFSLVTCGFASMLLAILIWIVDIRKIQSWGNFFGTFGVNPLFMYVMADILAILFGSIVFSYNGSTTNVIGLIYNNVLSPVFGNNGGSCIYAILFVLINWCIGYPLYKRKIYIKL